MADSRSILFDLCIGAAAVAAGAYMFAQGTAKPTAAVPPIASRAAPEAAPAIEPVAPSAADFEAPQADQIQ